MEIHEGDAAIALLSGGGYAGEANVVCPKCRSDYTHIVRVGTLKGSDKNEAVEAYEGTEQSGFTASRRSAVEIVFECERCPDPFSLVIQQHKGVNIVQVHEGIMTRPGRRV